jgi:hypothetical protein
MTDRGILFSATMVRALLDGRKTQTRRILRPPYGTLEYRPDGTWRPICTKFFPGDRLYVREAFSYEAMDIDRNGFMPPWYWADGNPTSGDFTRPKPSIHMPRWASRLTLTVTDVRVQRLKDISETDAEAEGVNPCLCGHQCPDGEHGGCCAMYDPVEAYRSLWNSLHGPDAWDANPWVCAVTFTVRRGNIDAKREMEAKR